MDANSSSGNYLRHIQDEIVKRKSPTFYKCVTPELKQMFGTIMENMNVQCVILNLHMSMWENKVDNCS